MHYTRSEVADVRSLGTRFIRGRFARIKSACVRIHGAYGNVAGMEYKLYLVVVAAAVAISHCQPAEPDCPNPVRCAADPCATATCPGFREGAVECRGEFCHGECRAEFYRGSKDVTDRCDLPSCDSTECPPRRACMEEEVPCDKPNCVVRRVKITCEQVEQPQPPSDCSAILCAPGQRCEVFESRNGRRAKCVTFTPDNCSMVECDEGMRCEERTRSRDGEIAARCIPVRTQSPPVDCSELECREGMECVVTQARAKCAKLPPPESCEELECEEGFECVVRAERNPRAICMQVERPTRDPQLSVSCDELSCGMGYECRLRGDRTTLKNSFVPTCAPVTCPVPRSPRSCDEMKCREEEECVERGEQRERTVFCRRSKFLN